MLKLIKASSPGWEKEFETEYDLIDELRRYICKDCLLGELEYIDFDGSIAIEIQQTPVDVYYNGVLHECRDLGTLLSTACGCEFWVEDEDD